MGIACRAGSTSPYAFGATLTAELATLHDMHGNVWEWCADHWHANYEGAPDDGRPWLDENAQERKLRLLRGGSWGFHPGSCRSAFRDYNPPGGRGLFLGFRVCCLPQD